MVVKNPYCFVRLTRIIVVSTVLFMLTACANKSRYSMEHDAIPKGNFDASSVPDAIPKWEPMSRQGNQSPYRVRGKTYHLVDTSKGFSEEGIASWYGLKFHGELTSNGEIYNTYGMTAAHKHLPLPSYVKVRNLENGREVVVRVNDRGPFHQGRVIDLSYAAAIKLGFADKGTARVRVDLIQISPENERVLPGESPSVVDRLVHFIQVAAFSSKEPADFMAADLREIASKETVFVAPSGPHNPSVYRVRVGPFASEKEAQEVLETLISRGYKGAQLIQRALSAKNS